VLLVNFFVTLLIKILALTNVANQDNTAKMALMEVLDMEFAAVLDKLHASWEKLLLAAQQVAILKVDVSVSLQLFKDHVHLDIPLAFLLDKTLVSFNAALPLNIAPMELRLECAVRVDKCLA